MIKNFDLQIILPAYNEEKSIPILIAEIDKTLNKNRQFSWQIIVSEDGSTDHTKIVLKKLANRYPLKLILSQKRKGYSQAIIDAFKMSTASFVLTLDSDGQCDPRDILKAWSLRHKTDIVIGWRKNRQDHLQRKLFSGGFKLLHKLLFGTTIHDPSCPLVLINRKSILKLVPSLGVLNQGFWWEFTARAIQTKMKIFELPVSHRARIDGKTRVYTLTNLPGIAISHTLGLFKIKLTDSNPQRFKIENLSSVLAIFFLSTLWILKNGYNCIRSDCHYYYFPIIEYFQKGILGNDVFIQFSTNKPYLYYQLIAFFSRFLDLNLILFGIVFLANFLFLYSLYKLSILLFNNKTIAYLSVFLGMYVPAGTLAYDYPQFVAHAMTFVTPILFISIWLFYKGRIYLSFLMAGILTNFHPVSGVLAGFILVLLFLSNRNNLTLKKISLSLSFFLLPLIPVIINVYKTQIQILDPSAVLNWLKIVRIRSPHHLFPDLWPINNYLIFGLYWLFVFLGFNRAYSTMKKEHQLFYFYAFIGTLFFLILTTILILIFNLKYVIQLTPFRMLVFLKYISLPLIAYLLYSYLIKNKLLPSIILPLLTLLLVIQSLFSLFINNATNLDLFGISDLSKTKRQTAIWIRNNTSQSAVLISPPYETGFRTDSQRAIIGDWKSGGLAIWDVQYANLWWLRMVDLSKGKLKTCTDYSQCLTDLKTGFEGLNEKEITFLSQKYSANLFISHNLNLTFPIIFQNEDYAVYQLKTAI